MSATAPAPLPRPQRDPDGDASAPAAPDGGRRPVLAVAGRPDPEAVTRTPAGDQATVPRPRPGDPHRFADDARLRMWLVPRTEPPAAPLRAVTPAYERPPVLGSPQALTRRRTPAAAGGADRDASATPAGPLPDPTRLCCAVVQAAVEGLRGVRPLAQLTRWVTPEVYDRLALRARLVQDAATGPSAARAGIRRVRVCRLGDGAAEATVVVDDGRRVRAVALRVEEHRGRWRATALEIG